MNIATPDIKIRKTENSRINQLNPDNIQFGKLYADHMYIAKYENGNWQTPEIMPYGNLSLSPATTFFHYGQAIFEGVKAYRNPQGEITVFRPHDNWHRMNVSAKRMAMPDVPEEFFIEGMRTLIELDKEWVPRPEGTALYIRPFMIATDEFIGVKPAEKFSFIIITSPTGPYYAKPVNIYVQDEYVRAFPGGTGFTKAAGNYGMVMYPTALIREEGYDQNLWMDGMERKYVQEIGTMNFFVVIGDKVLTPNTSDTILKGVTRDSVITLLKEKGYTVEERPISIDEIEEAHKNGQLKEAFGTGTAASIAPIASLTYKGDRMELPSPETAEITVWVKEHLNNIRYGKVEDVHGWNYKV